VRNRSQLGVLLVLTCLIGMACGLRDVSDHVRAYRGRNRIQVGATLPTVFDALVGLRDRGDWQGLLAGFTCEMDGKKRMWVLSRLGSGYVVITHPEDTPFAGQGDWKQEFTDPAGVREFLSQSPTSSCESYHANIGRWAFTFSLSPQTRKVQEVGPLTYHVGY
jgi:hypothetical protein